ncbi:MAG: archaeosine biosynthesis radical SAM protein RaSEA [Promethearchaeota archaeon]
MKNVNNINNNFNRALIDKIKSLRTNSLKKKKKFSKEQLEKPVAFWTKRERLINEVGKELTIILRTRGCSWALGETGGCSMCGYVQDANIDSVSSSQIIAQFDHALQNKLNEIETDNDNYVIKLYNSGSFFDDSEIEEDARKYIYEKIAEINNVKEVIVESRVEFLTPEKIAGMQEFLKKKYVEIGIGLETTNDYIRNEYINKSLIYDDFVRTFKRCKEKGLGIKAYLLLKPPFLNEQGAIDDCIASVRTLINLKVNTISINPVNIQKGSLVEHLFYQNRYRPPWFYSLFKCLKKAVRQQKELQMVRILSDPSGAGTKRGIHNCRKRECNEKMRTILRNFVHKQKISILKNIEYDCMCKKKYKTQINLY